MEGDKVKYLPNFYMIIELVNANAYTAVARGEDTKGCVGQAVTLAQPAPHIHII